MTRSLALHPLPQRDAHLFLNDSGLETTLVFHEGMTLPAFAAFPLLETAEGRAVLSRYYARHLAIAERHATGFVLDTPTWRANPDWGATLGYDAAALDRINTAACAFCQAIREEWQNRVSPIVLSGIVGPRGDGYVASFTTAAEAEDYHTPQIAAFARAGADMVAAYTLTTIDEAVGIAWA
ncbi:MAG TPA: homocysteine S-methyltransferase family protein, partial [Paracoccaceae bacterium]